MDDELRKAAGTAVDVWDDTGTRHEDVVNAMNDLRKVLAKNANAAPEQEPVGEVVEYIFGKHEGIRFSVFPAGYSLPIGTNLYTHPMPAPAAPEQQPVAWVEVTHSTHKNYTFHGIEYLPIGKHNLYTAPQPVSMEAVYDTIIEWSSAGKGSRRELARRMIALFAAPQREWQGLTKAEINDCAGAEIYPSSWAMAFAIGIEQTLRRKNHG